MESQFLRAQRMESIGTLAGGIAHDLNNVLSPILMAIDMLQLKATDEASKKWLDVLRTNAERGGNMVRQVLSFARGVEGERVALQPKHLIKEIVKILRETLPKSIEINFQDSQRPLDHFSRRDSNAPGAYESLCKRPRRNAGRRIDFDQS